MIKKGDSVIVITGGDKGKKGTVSKVFPKTAKVIVDGVNVKKIHQKPKTRDAKGMIVEVAKPISVSNVKLAQ